MPQVQSLDDLIAKKAIEYADQIKAAAAMADKEEEIRIESERQLAFIQKEAGIKLEGKHEFTVASGRVDSVYSRVIIEYKNPKSPGDRIGPKADSPGSKKVIEQIKKRFYDMRHEHGQPLNSLFGVGLDGNYFIFVRFRDEKWQVQEPVEVNRVSAERFLWALFNLGTKGKAFSPEYLAGDFGSEGGNTVAVSGIHALYDAIVTTDNPKAQTFFSQWKILFGEVCGYDVDSQSEKLRKLAEFYQVGVKDPKPAELLFAVHTYYALFMKLLAAEIVAFFHKLPTPLQKMMQATTSNKLKREMEDLEAGSIFRHLNITNFLEGDLFAWYTSVWTEPIEKLVREMVTRLDDYNPGTLSEDPAGSRDLLKKLYQQLFPKSVRHDLGEYYTPDWLAEHVLNELGYIGDPDKRLLDPACGSGTFLVMTINRIRKWYDENRERCTYDESELGRKILANVIGFDLNPLAVMAARTNYLIAIRDLIGHMDKVEIPVYLCDSILIPGEYGGLWAGNLGKAKDLKTAVTNFLIPTEITTNRQDIASYAEQLEFCIKNGYAPEEFILRCRDEGLPVEAESLHIDLYRELVSLDKANKNGVWARIIKNAFAPLFIGRVDYVAGNPPWIAWLNLPNEYRQKTANLWADYQIFPHKGLQARLGSAKDDISILFTYSCADNFLVDGGKLGFVITQTLFKSKGGGQGFRRFQIGDKAYLGIYKVDDMVTLQPFEDATNRTAVVVLIKGVQTPKEIPYVEWSMKQNSRIGFHMSLEEVLDNTVREALIAKNIDPKDKSSPWITGSPNILSTIRSIIGASFYKARMGAYFGATGVYWLDVLREINKNQLLVRNAGGGKKHIEATEMPVELQLVYPILRGKDIGRWNYNCRLGVLLPQDINNPSKPIPISSMRQSYPKSLAFLNRYEEILRSCALLAQYYDPKVDPFYSIYNVGTYSFAPFKVLWSQVANSLDTAVVSSCFVPNTHEQKVVIPDHSLCSISFYDAREAHYVSACLNSSISRWVVKSYIAMHPSPNIMNYLPITQYDKSNAVHSMLANLSEECHREALDKSADSIKLTDLQEQVDEAVSNLWKITIKQLKRIQNDLRTE